MSHFAELDENNVVLRVVVGDNSLPDEGLSWIEENLGGRWEKTSYTDALGKKVDPNTREVVSNNHFRYNFAGVGSIFYPEIGPNGAFTMTKLYDSWILNEEDCTWIPPIPKPDYPCIWDEETLSWKHVPPIVIEE